MWPRIVAGMRMRSRFESQHRRDQVMTHSMRTNRLFLRAALFAVLAVFIGCGCTVQLAPSPDQSLVTGIRSVNSDIMQLYATVGMGVDKSTFPQRIDQYNKIIGSVDALELQSKTRPVPDSALLQKVDQLIKQWLGANAAPFGPANDEPLTQAANACAIVRNVKPSPAFSIPTPTVQAASQPYIPASASALEQVSRAMRLIRDTDCSHGLNSGEVAANKGYTQYFISEALYYENLLNQ